MAMGEISHATECQNVAQIYRKVTMGMKSKTLFRDGAAAVFGCRRSSQCRGFGFLDRRLQRKEWRPSVRRGGKGVVGDSDDVGRRGLGFGSAGRRRRVRFSHSEFFSQSFQAKKKGTTGGLYLVN
ncbi:hypothetical protein U1Q18_015039 [Sarracenia purpurea var. burkii]